MYFCLSCSQNVQKLFTFSFPLLWNSPGHLIVSTRNLLFFSGIVAYAIGLYAFWKVHRLAIFIFLVLSVLDLGAMFAFAYIEEFYNSTPLLVLQFLVVLVKFFGLYNAYVLWTQLTQDPPAGGLSPEVALDV
jgi:hypothetical protein